MSQLPEVFSITVFQPLQTSNQSSKIHYCIAGINKDLLINGRMKTEGRLEAYKESKDGPVQHYPQECVPPCSNALLNAWPCARHMWVPALLKRMSSAAVLALTHLSIQIEPQTPGQQAQGIHLKWHHH